MKKKDKINVEFSDDYSSLKVGEHEFYYGWEEQDEEGDGDWDFVYRRNQKEVARIAGDKLMKLSYNPPLEPSEYLLVGIGQVIKDVFSTGDTLDKTKEFIKEKEKLIQELRSV